jgi:hypothetical protein
MVTGRTIVAAGTMVLLLALTVPAGASAACGQEYKGAPQQSTTPGGPPLAIGDSVLADAVPSLVRDGFEADGMVCRQMSQGLTILKERAGRLPHLVVLALGTNGEVTPQQIETALAVLGPGRVLVLVTPHGSVLPSTPRVIRSAAAANPQRIVLLDWDRLAAEHPDWLAPDGVHLGGAAGIEGFAAMVAGTLPYATAAAPEEASSDSEPGTPVTLAAPRHTQPAPHRRPRVHHRSAPSTTTSVPATTTASSPAPVVAADPPRRAITPSSGGSGGSGALIAGGVAALLVLLVAATLWWYKRSRG